MNRTTHGPWRTFWLPLAFIVSGGLAIRYLHFSLTLGSDDQVWLTVAREIATGMPRTDEAVYYTRLVWTWVLVAWSHLGSFTLGWTAVMMFALSGLTMGLTAAAARIPFGERAALLAALVYAAHPLAVAYDTATLPDGLAVCMLAATMWRFMRYLEAPRAATLIVPGLLIGLLFGVKNYYMLVSIACAIAILARLRDPRLCVRPVGTLALSALAGLGLALLLGALSGVEGRSHVASFGNYVAFISQDPADASVQGLRQLLMLLVGRAEAFVSLFLGPGALMGALTLFGLIHSTLESRRAPAQLFLAVTALLFLSFLMLMPVRFSPLTFTQFHERYLTVLLPALAISTGVAMTAAWARLDSPALRAAAAGLLVAIVGSGAWSPNAMQDSYGRLEMRGLAQIARAHAGKGTAQLLLPAYMRRLVPSDYRGSDVQFHFVDLATPAGARAALDRVAADPSASIAIFRAPYRTITEKLRTGDYVPETGYGNYAELMREAHARGYAIEEVRVPYDTARVWLGRIGMTTRGQLVAWVVGKPHP